MLNLGTVRPGRTVYITFESFANATGAPITITGFIVNDIRIFRDGGSTARASSLGVTLLDTDGIDIAGITGVHGFSIDLSDNSTAGFYAAGSSYMVVVSTITVDSQTMSFLAAFFRIGYDGALLNTTLASVASQTNMVLVNGPGDNDALNGLYAVFHDVASAVQMAYAKVLDYVGSTKTVILEAAPAFTVAPSDNVSFFLRSQVADVVPGGGGGNPIALVGAL